MSSGLLRGPVRIAPGADGGAMRLRVPRALVVPQLVWYRRNPGASVARDCADGHIQYHGPDGCTTWSIATPGNVHLIPISNAPRVIGRQPECRGLFVHALVEECTWRGNKYQLRLLGSITRRVSKLTPLGIW